MTTSGLNGVTAGTSAISTVGQADVGLTYRGYSITDLAANSTFEEVAYLLIYGRLPGQKELDAYKIKLAGMRTLPDALKTLLEALPASTHPMDVLRTGTSLLGTLEPEGEGGRTAVAVGDRLTASFGSMLAYWYRFHSRNERIETESDEETVAGHFLSLMSGKPADPLKRDALDTTLVLYAEHEFNASTFTARVITSTLSDTYSAIAGAIGALRGPLHGMQAALPHMIEQKSGKIITISSLSALGPSTIMVHYGAAKAGVINLTKSLAAAWAKHNINVNCIAPGPVATEGAKMLGFLPPEKNADGTPKMGCPRLFIFDGMCNGFIDEVESVGIDEKGVGVIDKRDTHDAIDATKYLFSENPGYFGSEDEQQDSQPADDGGRMPETGY